MLTGKQKKESLRRRIIIIAVVGPVPSGFMLVFMAFRAELRDQVIHMVLDPLPHGIPNRPRHGGCHCFEVEIRVAAKEVTEDARSHPCKEIADLLLHEPAHPLRASFKPLHDLGEESKVTGIVGHKRAGDANPADAVQGTTSPLLEAVKHLGARVLEAMSSASRIRCPFREWGDLTHLLIKGCQLSFGRGLSIQSSLHTPLRLGQLPLEVINLAL